MAAFMQHQHHVSLSLVHRYAGIIYAIVAIVAHAHPSELEAVLIRLSSTSSSPSFSSAQEVGIEAEQASKDWLNQAALETDASSWQSDVFQTSFLLMKLCKFLGRWTEYKECLVRDVGRLQRAKYHRMSAIMGSNSLTEIATRHRIFWHYFTLERCSLYLAVRETSS